MISENVIKKRKKKKTLGNNKIPYPGRPGNSTSGHTLRRRERRLHHVEDIRQ